MYYGNPAAIAASNGTNTFDFFDDFAGSVLSANWPSNNGGAGSITVSGGQVVLNGINGTVSMYSAFTPTSTSFIIEAKHKEGSITVTGFMLQPPRWLVIQQQIIIL